MKRSRLFLVLLMLMMAPAFFFSGRVLLAEEKGIIEAGNKFCPVSGDKVSGKDFVVYEGKRYSMCCGMCQKDFKKNPKKFIAKMEEQEKSGKAPVSGMMMQDEHAGHEHH